MAVLYQLQGALLAEEVAGAIATCGLPLADVAAEAKRASEMVGTMGVVLSVCTLPGQHGEPGATVADVQPVDVVVSRVLIEILSSVCEYLECESST